MKTRYKAILILFALALAAVVTEPYTKLCHRVADVLIYNNHRQYLPCSDLPELGEVEDIAAQRPEVIEQIGGLSPGNIEVVIDSMTCPGKASIAIYYANTAEREKIDEILPDKTFFGVPTSLINR